MPSTRRVDDAKRHEANRLFTPSWLSYKAGAKGTHRPEGKQQTRKSSPEEGMLRGSENIDASTGRSQSAY